LSVWICQQSNWARQLVRVLVDVTLPSHLFRKIESNGQS
jgi:hypothetical protein